MKLVALVVSSLMLSAFAPGCAASDGADLEAQSAADELVATPSIVDAPKGITGNAILDGIRTAANKDLEAEGHIAAYNYDLKNGKNTEVTLAAAKSLATKLYTAKRVAAVTEVNLIPAQPYNLNAGLRLMAKAFEIGNAIRLVHADEPAELDFAIAKLDPRVRKGAHVYKVNFKPGFAGPQSAYLMVDQGAIAGKGSFLEAFANFWAD